MTPKAFTNRLLVCLLTLTLAASYNATAQEPLAALLGKEQVAAFLNEDQDVTATVGDFRKVDLNGDGRQELVATVDYSGRAFFNTVIVVWQDSRGTRRQTIDVWNMESLEGAIRDLDADGKLEIVAPQLLTPYLGTRPYAVWPVVHALAGREFVDASSRFPAFYENDVLPALKETLGRLGDPEQKHDAEVTEVAIYKVQRTIGVDRQAGLQRAVAWSSSDDPLTRIYAAAVLEDIAGPEAASALQKLAKPKTK